MPKGYQGYSLLDTLLLITKYHGGKIDFTFPRKYWKLGGCQIIVINEFNLNFYSAEILN